MSMLASALPGLPDWAGTLPGWITSAGVLGVLGLLLRYHLGLRRLAIDSKKVDGVEATDIREHYAREVHDLREAVIAQSERHRADIQGQWERYTTQMNESEERFRRAIREAEESRARCEQDRDNLGKEVHKLRDEVDGLRRQIAQYSAEAVLTLDRLGGEISDEVVQAAHRVIERHAELELDKKASPGDSGDASGGGAGD